MPLAYKLVIYFRMTRTPMKTFAELSEQPLKPWSALGWMLLFRVPLAWALTAINYTSLLRAQQTINDPAPALLDFVGRFIDQADGVFYELQHLPDLPSLNSMWLWLGLFAFLGIIGLWMHNVAWDHTALWILRGTKPKPSLHFSCAAIAEAMGAASFGSLISFIATMPIVGLSAIPIISAVNLFYWGLRGVSLAAYHSCPVWKGIAAVVLHVFLVILFYGLVFSLAALLVMAIMVN